MQSHELQLYFNRVYPSTKITSEESIVGNIHIRFELGGELDNGTSERVNQAVERSLALFNDTFPNPANEIWILIYEYQGQNIFNANNKYLHEQFPAEKFANFQSQMVGLQTDDVFVAGKESDAQENDEVKIITGKLQVADINVNNILRAIANTEMGFEPGIDQRIFFFDTNTDKAFYMYDDRGCYVWSDNADNIRDVYLRRNDWIADYHRPAIDTCFK